MNILFQLMQSSVILDNKLNTSQQSFLQQLCKFHYKINYFKVLLENILPFVIKAHILMKNTWLKSQMFDKIIF